MDIINLKIRFIIDWLISKKTVIYRLSCDGLPIFRTISTFIKEYLDMIYDFISLVDKVKKEKRANLSQQDSIIQTMNLIRKKQESSIEQWKESLKVLKESLEGKIQPGKIETIFENLDKNIEYYQKLKEKLAQMVRKTSKYNFQSQKYIEKYYKHKEKHYEAKFNTHQPTRQTGRIKKVKQNQQQTLSSYKLVNPVKIQGYQSQRQKRIRYNLEEEMEKDLQLKHIYRGRREKTPKKQIIKTPDKPYSYKTPPKEKYEKSEQTVKKTVRKYQYLFELNELEDQVLPITTKKKSFNEIMENQKKLKNQPFRYDIETKQEKESEKESQKEPQKVIQEKASNNLTIPTEMQKIQESLMSQIELPDDSLEDKDSLGDELRNEVRNEDDLKNLQKILAESLMSSKRWSFHENQNDDSLDDIRETAKFNYNDLKLENIQEISFG